MIKIAFTLRGMPAEELQRLFALLAGAAPSGAPRHENLSALAQALIEAFLTPQEDDSAADHTLRH